MAPVVKLSRREVERAVECFESALEELATATAGQSSLAALSRENLRLWSEAAKTIPGTALAIEGLTISKRLFDRVVVESRGRARISLRNTVKWLKAVLDRSEMWKGG